MRMPQLPHGVSSGCVQLSVSTMHSDHLQKPSHDCLPLPAAVVQARPESGPHASSGSTQARSPVMGSHAPERTPQLPHGVSRGSVQLSELSTQSDQRQLLLHD
jgi:hypothetical protein